MQSLTEKVIYCLTSGLSHEIMLSFSVNVNIISIYAVTN